MQFNYGMGSGFAKRVKPIPMPLPPDEVAYFADSYSGDTRMLFIQLYLFGQRISEALATKRGDISIEDNGTVMVLNSITEKNKQMPFRVLPARVSGMGRHATLAAVKNLLVDLIRAGDENNRVEVFNTISKIRGGNA